MANPTRFGEGEAKLRAMHRANYPGGVVVDPTPITASEDVTVFYNGVLAKDNDQIYLHYGFGPHNRWRTVRSSPMEKTGWGWVSELKMPDIESRFNFCFRNGGEQWDNNHGVNWSFEIHNGGQ